MKFRKQEDVETNDDLLVFNNNAYESAYIFEGEKVEDAEVPYHIKQEMEKMKEKLIFEPIVNAINELNKRLVVLEKDKR
jgi:hypothetical protein